MQDYRCAQGVDRMNLSLDIYQLQQLRPLGAVKLKATVDLKHLSTKGRNMAVKYLESGWIRTTDKSGVGLLVSQLMGPTIWHLRGNQKYRLVSWGHNPLPGPREVIEALQMVVDADNVAAGLQGEDQYKSLWNHCFRVLKPEEHIPPLLEAYVSSPGYQSAVQPLIELVKSGGKLAVDVKPPKFNGVRMR